MQTPVIITNSDNYLEISGNFIESVGFEENLLVLKI